MKKIFSTIFFTGLILSASAQSDLNPSQENQKVNPTFINENGVKFPVSAANYQTHMAANNQQPVKANQTPANILGVGAQRITNVAASKSVIQSTNTTSSAMPAIVNTAPAKATIEKKPEVKIHNMPPAAAGASVQKINN